MPSPGQSSAAPAAIRSQVRDAVARAWDAAVQVGGAARDRGRGRAAGRRHRAAREPGVRRSRHQPRHAARAAAAAVAAGHRRGARRGDPHGSRRRADRLGRGRAARVREPAAGGLGARVDRRRRPRGARLAGAGSSPTRRARVDVEFVSANPTGPLHIGNARGAFVGDLLSRVLEAGGQRVTREYYFNDFGAQVRKLGESVLATRNGEPVADDGYHGEYVADLAAAVPDDVAAAAAAPGADGAEVLGRWASERVRAGIEASPRAARGALRRLEVGGLAAQRGLGRSRDRAPAGRRAPVRAGRRAVVPVDDVRRRQGSRAHPVDGRAHLLRGRRRLRRREAQPGLRPPDLHLGRRPPRLHHADPRGGGGHGLRSRPGRGPAHRLGVDPARGTGRRDVEAGRRHLPAGHAPGRDRQRRGPLVLRVTRHAARHRGRRGPGPPPVVREPRLLRPVRPRADRLDPAQGRRRRPVARRPTSRACSPASPRRCSSGRSRGTPRSSRTPSRPRRPRGSPPTRPSSRPSSTPSIATRASWTRSSRSGRRSGSRWRSRR